MKRLKKRAPLTCLDCSDYAPAIGKARRGLCLMFGIPVTAKADACRSCTPKPGVEQLELIHRRERL